VGARQLRLAVGPGLQQVQPLVGAGVLLGPDLQRGEVPGQFLGDRLARLGELLTVVDQLHRLLQAERDQDAADDRADLDGEFAQAVGGLRFVDVHGSRSPKRITRTQRQLIGLAQRGQPTSTVA